MALANSTVRHHWNLDETDGNDRVDSVGTNDLTENGAHTYDAVAGKVDEAVDLDGTAGQYLVSDAQATERIGDNYWTIACWVKFDSLAAAAGIAAKYSTTGNGRDWRLWMFAAQPGIQFRVYTSAGSEASGVPINNGVVLATGKWYLVVAFHDPVANTINIWVQAEDAMSVTKASTALVGGSGDQTLTPMRVGNDNAVATIDGQIDQMTIWKGGSDSAPTDEEFDIMFNEGNGAEYPYSFIPNGNGGGAGPDQGLVPGGTSHIYAPPFISF